MYILLGLVAVIAAFLNFVFALQHKETKWLRFCSMAFTALTMCGFYSDAKRMVLEQDWSELMDVLPSISNILWVCVLASILLNGATLFIKKR